MSAIRKVMTEPKVGTFILVIMLLSLGWLLDKFFSVNFFWPGYISIIVFYGLIFYVASNVSSPSSADPMLARKSLPLWLAVFTMSATWVGGGFINGSAEYTYSSGLVWVQAPWGYALSLILGGLIFARPMRDKGYTTLLDPILQKFGTNKSILYYLPALMGDVFWTSAILVALGTTFGTILGVGPELSIVISAVVVIIYTAMGGLWAVAVTDVIQLIILIFGLLLTLPFLLKTDAGVITVWGEYKKDWGAAASFFPSKAALGNQWALWWDYALLLVMGGIPWQVYFQRVLAAKTSNVAVRLSVVSGFVCLVAAVPAILIGIVGFTTDWQALGLPLPPDDSSILPHVIRYLTNPVVATIGLGAIAAAVMSSADSSILSSSTLTVWNVLRKPAEAVDQKQIGSHLKKAIWVIGIACTLIALNVRSIYELWVLCSDLVYCLLFPALVTALFDRHANGVGAVSGFVVALFLRLGGGEPVFGLPPFLAYPMDVDGTILVPFRTIAMLSGLTTIVVVSRLVKVKS